jgi:hypothetical protein
MSQITLFDPRPESLRIRFANEPSVSRYPESALRRIEAVGWDVDDHTGCYLWRGQLTGNRRAKFNLPEGNRNAARLLWLLVRGAVPEGLEVAHQCHNPQCVNLDHLEVQTSKKNHEAERGKPGHPNAGRKPSIDAARDASIRQSYDGGMSARAVAKAENLGDDVVRASLHRTGTMRAPGRPRRTAVFGVDWTCAAHGDDCPKHGLDWDCADA